MIKNMRLIETILKPIGERQWQRFVLKTDILLGCLGIFLLQLLVLQPLFLCIYVSDFTNHFNDLQFFILIFYIHILLQG